MHNTNSRTFVSPLVWMVLLLGFSLSLSFSGKAQSTPAPTEVQPPKESTEAAPPAPSEGVTEPPSAPAPPPVERPKGLRLEIGPAMPITDEEASSTAVIRSGSDVEHPEASRKISGKYYRITITNRTEYPCIIDNFEIPSLTNEKAEESFSFLPLPLRLQQGTSREFYLLLEAPPSFSMRTLSADVLGYFEIQKEDPKQRVPLRQAFPLSLQNPQLMRVHCSDFSEKDAFSFWIASHTPPHIARKTVTCTNEYWLPMKVSFRTTNPAFFLLPTDLSQVPSQRSQAWGQEAVPVLGEFFFDVAYDSSSKEGVTEAELIMEVEPTTEQATLTRTTEKQTLAGHTFSQPVRFEVTLPRGGTYQNDDKSRVPIIDFGKMAQNELGKSIATITIWTYEPFAFRKENLLQPTLTGTDMDHFVLEEQPHTGKEPKRVFTIRMKEGLQLGAMPTAKLQFSGILGDRTNATYKKNIAFSFQLRGMVEKPVQNKGKILLGQVSQEKEFPLPVKLPVVLDKQIPFIAHVIDSQGKPVPSVRILPENEKSGGPLWKGKTLHFVTTPDAPQNLDATFELRVGNPANPDIYRWSLQGKIIPVLEQKPVDLGEIMPGYERRTELSWPPNLFAGGLITSWTAILQNIQPNTLPWISLPRYGSALSSGSVEPVLLDYGPPVKGPRGINLSARVFVEVTGPEEKKMFVSTPVKGIISSKTPWIFDVSMSHLALNLYHGKNDCYNCGPDKKPTSNDFSQWEYLWMLRGNVSYALPMGYYLEEKSTHVEARPGLTAMTAFSPNTQMVGIGGQIGLGIYPGGQRFWQIHLLPFLEYRYVGIPQVQFSSNGTFALADHGGEHRFAGGLQANLLVDLGKKFPSAHGWSIGGGWQLSGMYGGNGSYGSRSQLQPGEKGALGTLETGLTLFVQNRFGF